MFIRRTNGRTLDTRRLLSNIKRARVRVVYCSLGVGGERDRIGLLGPKIIIQYNDAGFAETSMSNQAHAYVYKKNSNETDVFVL